MPAHPRHSRAAIGIRQTLTLRVIADTVLTLLAAVWAWIVCFGQIAHPISPLPFLLCVFCVRFPLYLLTGSGSTSWRHFSLRDILRLALTTALGTLLYAGLFLALPAPFNLTGLVRPYMVFLTEPAFHILFLGGARLAMRAYGRRLRPGSTRRVLIIGAGAAARALAFQIEEASAGYHIVGFVDDAAELRGHWVRGHRVLGRISDLREVARRYQVEQLIIAIPSLKPDRLREVLRLCQAVGEPVRILPSIGELIDGEVRISALRQVQMADLLPRPQISLDSAVVDAYLQDKTVLVTGGGGSIGRELCRQVLRARARRVLVLGRGENSVFEAIQELSELDAPGEHIPIICDVQNRGALQQVFEQFRPQVVFHAAAHKHVPLMEQYPCEAIRNNVLGTLNLVQLAVEYATDRLVLISTDKAVNPANIMGATKRVAEQIVRAYAEASGIKMVSVRFGNVLGSRGSVVPTMQRQIERRQPVTVTDPEMVRYFMTIPEAVSLVLHAGAHGGAGEVYVLNMGHPVRIIDIAQDLIRLSGLVPEVDIPIRIIGRRPGEKIAEELLTPREAECSTNGEHYCIAPPEPTELNELLAHIERLRVAARDHSRAQVIAILRDMIPAFELNGEDRARHAQAERSLP